jgi:hypothetical protein
MKILLTGHDYSKMILPTSSWLWNKYVPKEFDIKYLNFGDYDGKLFRGEYISLAEEQEGERHAWAKYIYDYVKKLRDKYVIVGCDDFLINSKVDMKCFRKLKSLLGDNVKCARLSDVKWYPVAQYNHDAEGIVSLKRDADYSCTGQLTIWDRKALLELLEFGGSVWDFESGGSKKMQENDWAVVAAYEEPFKYCTISALSGADNRIDLAGVNDKDREYIINNLITKGDVK